MNTGFAKSVLPFAALGGAALLSACDGPSVSIVGGDDGVPLAELDQSATVPTRLVLGAPDRVTITEGDKLTITVTGDPAAVDNLRFTLDDSTIGITRDRTDKAKGVALIAVTMPATERLVLAGSGEIAAPTLKGDAEVVIAGSGRVRVAQVTAGDLDVNVLGSGTLTAAGTADRLELNLAGSGNLLASGLKVGSAEINVAGSGGGSFASDGTVQARIAGSGDVTVTGNATCSVEKIGSGSLRCSAGQGARAAR